MTYPEVNLTRTKKDQLMNTKHLSVKFLAVALLSLMTFAPVVSAQDKLTPDEVKAQQAYAIGVQAYIWGFPMVKMQGARDMMTTNISAPVTPEEFKKTGKFFAPVNQVASA